ncbi:MAG: hypothetical protein ACRDO2_10015 [Nocardioidaceae bacterium]
MALFVRRTSSPTAVIVPPTADAVADLHDLVEAVGGRHLLHAEVRGADEDGQPGAGGSGKPTGQPPAGGEAATKQAGASTDETKKASPHPAATIAGAAVFLIGLIIAVNVFGTSSGPGFSPAEGIGAFTLFYIVAQATERFVELFVPTFEKIGGLKKTEHETKLAKSIATSYDPAARTARVHELATAPAPADPRKKKPTTPEEEAANAQGEIDQARANRTIFVFGLAAALGMALCGYLEADFLTTVGVDFKVPDGKQMSTANQVLALAVTGLVVGGGSKGLHDLIGNISKSKEDKETPAETK